MWLLAVTSCVALVASEACSDTTQPVASVADPVCDQGAADCISPSLFQKNIADSLRGHTVGFVVVVGDVERAVTVGYARLPGDGFEAWTVDVAINQMSLSKIFTTIAVLQVMDKHHLGLDTKIGQFLPPDWKHGQEVDDITVQELLTHRSGFRQWPDAATTYAELQQQIEAGVGVLDRGVANYNNLNFALFRVVLAAMDGQRDPGAATRDQVTSAWYVAYLREHVFQPIGVTDVDCKPVGEAPAMFYPTKTSVLSSRGNDGGDWTALCAGAGWSLSARAVHRLLVSLAGDERVLTTAQKADMTSRCLGWDCSNTLQRGYVGKRGDWHDQRNGQVHTFMGLFGKTKIPVVLIVNSPMPVDTQALVESAYAHAHVPR